MIPFLNPEHNPYDYATLDTTPPWHLCTGSKCQTCAEYPAKLKQHIGQVCYDSNTRPSQLTSFHDGRKYPVPSWPSKLLPSTTAIIVHGAHWQESPLWTVLIHKRSDNGWWGFPGGSMEIGETLEQCLKREILEETGLYVRPIALTSIDSDPVHGAISVYPDGNVVHYVNHTFLCEVVTGATQRSSESIKLSWHPIAHQAFPLPTPFLYTHTWRLQQAIVWRETKQVSVR